MRRSCWPGRCDRRGLRTWFLPGLFVVYRNSNRGPAAGIPLCDYGDVRTFAPFPVPTMTMVVPEEATPPRGFDGPVACGVHVTPSGDVTMALVEPVPPTATNCVPVQMTSSKLADVTDVRGVHVTPSGEVRTEPLSPTATNLVPDQVTAL